MIQFRRDAEIFQTEGGWFSARWHFSFDHYRDPENMGWGTLRVFNDDRLIPGAIWPLHPHRDVEGGDEHARVLMHGDAGPARRRDRLEEHVGPVLLRVNPLLGGG